MHYIFCFKNIFMYTVDFGVMFHNNFYRTWQANKMRLYT